METSADVGSVHGSLLAAHKKINSLVLDRLKRAKSPSNLDNKTISFPEETRKPKPILTPRCPVFCRPLVHWRVPENMSDSMIIVHFLLHKMDRTAEWQMWNKICVKS